MREGRGFAERRTPVPCEPDIAFEFKNVVVGAVRWAWSEVTSRWPGVIAHGQEEQITERLQRVLNELDKNSRRRAPGLELFDAVGRGGKVTTTDGRIEKAPDLVFRPPNRKGVRNLTDWGFFVECKIVDATARHHSAGFYCANGVARFVNGEYAYRMPSGMMLAFVRDRSVPHRTLSPLLATDYFTVSHTPGGSTDESSSVHDRRAVTCVSIALLHLWLQAA